MTMLLFLLLTQIPLNYGSRWIDPTLYLIPSTWYGQRVVSQINRNIEVDGFRIPYTEDVSLFYSGFYDADFNLFSIRFRKKVYDKTRPFTVLNSERGYGNYASAGFIFGESYRKLSFSIATNYINDGFNKYSVVSPSLGYGSFQTYYYRFIQDTGRYFRLYYAGYTGKLELSGIYGESVGRRKAFFHGFSVRKVFGDQKFYITGEFLSNGKNYGKAGFTYKALNLAIVKPFFQSRVFPEFIYTQKLKSFVATFRGITADSSYRTYFMTGVEGTFLNLLAGYGRVYDGTGQKGFIAGKMVSRLDWKNWHFKVAGTFYSEEKFSFDSLRVRAKLTYSRVFKRENYLKISGIADFFGTPILSVEIEAGLFNSVFVRIGEINLMGREYPFEFPENGERVYRISVAAILFD